MTENEILWRVWVYCPRCGAEYLSRALKQRKAPVRCKECKSSKLRTHPEKSPVYNQVNPENTSTISR